MKIRANYYYDDETKVAKVDVLYKGQKFSASTKPVEEDMEFASRYVGLTIATTRTQIKITNWEIANARMIVKALNNDFNHSKGYIKRAVGIALTRQTAILEDLIEQRKDLKDYLSEYIVAKTELGRRIKRCKAEAAAEQRALESEQ